MLVHRIIENLNFCEIRGAVPLLQGNTIGRHAGRRKTRVPLVPLKPNEFFNATSIFMSRASLAQKSRV